MKGDVVWRNRGNKCRILANAHVLRTRLPNYQAMNATLLHKPFDVQALVDPGD
jgi:hypothetical protein